MIYVLKTKNSTPPFIKIGFAKRSLQTRIKALQTGCPFELELIFAKNGGLKDEKILHEKLANHKTKGEWFNWNEETAKEFGLSENPKPINPMSPVKFLTPRQKQLNYLFKKSLHNENWMYAQSLELFLANHQYKERELFEFPKHKAKFRIFESTKSEVMLKLGSLKCGNEDRDEEKRQLFIAGIEMVNWRAVYNKELAPLLTLNDSGTP